MFSVEYSQKASIINFMETFEPIIEDSLRLNAWQVSLWRTQ